MSIFITVGCKLKCTHGSPNEDCDACKCDGDWTGDKCGEWWLGKKSQEKNTQFSIGKQSQEKNTQFSIRKRKL